MEKGFPEYIFSVSRSVQGRRPEVHYPSKASPFLILISPYQALVWMGNYESEALKFLEEESLCMGSCPALCGMHASWGSETFGVPVLPFPGKQGGETDSY